MFVHRPIVMTREGMVVAGNHHAAEAGAQVLRDGGNAMDACVTAAATLAVTIPFMNGVGGDAFALWYDRRRERVQVINGSGRAPLNAHPDLYKQRGYAYAPQRGGLAVSVPGAPRAWADALSGFGTLSLTRAIAPAQRYAERGFPLDRVLRDFLHGDEYRQLVADYPALAGIFGAPGSQQLGAMICQPALARSLAMLASDGVGSLYGGEAGRSLVDEAKAQDALLCEEDMQRHETLIQDPLHVKYCGYDVFAAPANSQGISLLAILGLLDAGVRAELPFECRFLDLKRLAFGLRDRCVGDPEVSGDLQQYLTKEHLHALCHSEGLVTGTGRPVHPAGGDTTTVVAVDSEGNAVSWVQSLFEAFGSCVVSEKTGIILHNRLYGARVESGHPNSLIPGRRPFHTLCPAMVLGASGCRTVLATPGDHGQPQTLAQVLYRLLERGMDIQEAIETPRIRHDGGDEVLYENRLDQPIVSSLEAHGYRARDVGAWARVLGGVNAIDLPSDQVRMGGADPRRACYAIAQ